MRRIRCNTRFLITAIILAVFMSPFLAKEGYATGFSMPNTFVLNHFSATNKLPGESVQCIYQDKLGILWLGIESAGVIKYDGKTTTVFKNDPDDSLTISTNYPIRILEDNDGFIWIATSNGLNRLNRHTGGVNRFYSSPDNPNSLSSNTVNDIILDKLGNIWAATSNGVTIVNPRKNKFIKTIHNPDFSRPANDNEIFSLHIDKEENIWIGSSLQGLYMIPRTAYVNALNNWDTNSSEKMSLLIKENINWQQKIVKKGIYPIRTITSSNPDTIWVGSQNGLYYFLKKTKEFHKFKFSQPEHANLNNCTYLDLFIDSNNFLWAGSSNDGLAIINLNNNKIIHLTEDNYANNNLKSNAIREILQTKCGLIWIATKFAGLHYFDWRQQTFPLLRKAIGKDEGLSHDFVLCATEDSEGYIWIGTKSGGLNRYNPKTNSFTWFIKNNKPGSIQSNRIEQIVEDKHKTLWFATEDGLLSKDKNSAIFEKRLPLHVRNIYIHKNSHLWIGTSNGIYRFSLETRKLDPLKTRHTDFFDTESNIAITRVFEDSKGILWIATSTNGLFEYHANNDSIYNHLKTPYNPHTISGNQVRAIFEDSRKNLWIGTKSDGLNLYNYENKTFKHVSTQENLPSNTIYNIVEDDNYNLWMGTHSGISRFNPTTNKFYNYSTHHGLQGLIFEINAFGKTMDGHIFMGGSQGLNIFNPNAIGIKTYEAPLIISKFSIFNNVQDIDISNNSVYHLDSRNNYISFDFALLDYSNPDENSYAYMLEPFDENWIYAENRNFATYTNLLPGKYVFKLKAANSDDIWMNEELQITLVIPAPLWKKPWFTPVFIVFIIFLVSLAYVIKIIAGKHREAQLKEEVKQRIKDLSEAYKKLEEFNAQIETHNTALRQQRDRISRQNLELKIHRQNLELMVADRTKDLEEAKLQAEESDRLKSAFLANMSHEIRTPLNAIVGFIDVLQADEFNKEETKFISDIIQTNSNALLQLINDIVDISMIEANQMIVKKNKLDFNSFLSEIKTHYSANKDVKERSIEIIKQAPNEQKPFFINTDSSRVRQIFYNLINNAIKFTENGTIEFGYTIEQNQITCYVRDTGIGISEENIQLLFERFRKIEPTENKIHRGTGLGLSISKHLCELLGGTIWVKSELGSGSTFYFSLPSL
jgi:signal transduction histidine kinase/ligand-binding sensor domain-containing protein